MSKFVFLEQEWPKIYRETIRIDESFGKDDAVTRLGVRRALERIIDYIFEQECPRALPEVRQTKSDIDFLCSQGIFDREIAKFAHVARRGANAGTHTGDRDAPSEYKTVESLLGLANWFAARYGHRVEVAAQAPSATPASGTIAEPLPIPRAPRTTPPDEPRKSRRIRRQPGVFVRALSALVQLILMGVVGVGGVAFWHSSTSAQLKSQLVALWASPQKKPEAEPRKPPPSASAAPQDKRVSPGSGDSVTESQFVGKWKGERFITEYRGNGTFVVDPEVDNQVVGKWYIYNNILTKTNSDGQTSTLRIISLDAVRVVIETNDGNQFTWQRVIETTHPSRSSSRASAPALNTQESPTTSVKSKTLRERTEIYDEL